jgi:tetratricopeptide (TPR) repeat protein
MSADQLQQKLNDILHDRNTLHAEVAKFWSHPLDLKAHWKLIDNFEQHSKFDSVVSHLNMIARDASHPIDSRKAALRSADLQLRVKGYPKPIETMMSALGMHGADSALRYEILSELQDFFKLRKKPDSAKATYDQMMALAGQRDPDLLNNEAWYLGSKSNMQDTALSLINEALATHPNEASYYDTRALIEKNLQRYDDAIRDEELAIKHASRDDKKEFEEQLTQYRNIKTQAEAASKEEDKTK